MTPRQYAKALIGALIAGLSALTPSVQDGLSVTDVLTAVVAALIAGSAVFAIPNVAPVGQISDPNLSDQDAPDAPTILKES